MKKERVRIFNDGKLQLLTKHVSRLFDPYAEGEPKGSFWRWVVANFDHNFNKFHGVRRKLFRDEKVSRLVQLFKREKSCKVKGIN